VLNGYVNVAESNTQVTPEQLSKETDRCVKCGLCLPHCPTYRLTRDEGDSPRGRIALIQALASGALDSPRLTRHLDRCLGCRACEPACPSAVHYGDIIDAARTLKAGHGGRRHRHLLNLLARLPYWRGSLPLVRRYQTSAIRRLVRRLAGQRLRRLDDMLPDITTPRTIKLNPKPPRIETPESGTSSRVALFTGCVGRISDHLAIQAALDILPRLGTSVAIPDDQGCCGAMHQHNGFPEHAIDLARANCKAFTEADTIIYLASGCGAQLSDYGRMKSPLGAPIMEICHYLEASGLAAALRLAPSDRKVVVHTPCSLRYPLRGGDWVMRLLRRIPGIDLLALQDTGCCGAAGTNVLTQPELADQLRQVTLDAIDETNPQLLVTSNTGCAMHLAAGLKQRGSNVEVLHPIQLIQRQLR